MKNAIQTTHNLEFKIAPDPNQIATMICQELGILDDDDDPYPDIPWVLFRVGTCDGQWRKTPEAYEILSVINDKPGNGHLDDVLEWFEYACKRSRLPLRIREFFNERFKRHLIEKRGFVETGEDVEKRWIAKK